MKPDITAIPKEPGVYQFFNKEDKLVYIGKAKDLRNRVRSYWSKGSDLEPAKQQMVREITRVEYIVVDNEKEALLLEAGLIKKNKPHYNIELKDDRSWTYIVITDEPFPRIVRARGSQKIKGEYFGPFTRAGASKTLLRLIHQVLPLRTCKRNLAKLPNGLVCMQYHLGKCLGPCEKRISHSAYETLIRQARSILKGDTKALLQSLRREMHESSAQQSYEKAALLRNKIRALESLSERQHIVHPLFANQDIVNIAYEPHTSVITVMELRNGQILDTFHFTIENKLQLSKSELLEQFIMQYYTRKTAGPVEISLPLAMPKAVERALAPLHIQYPQRGRKKRMLAIAEKNAWVYYHKKTKTDPLPQSLYQLQEILELPQTPARIEVYDISNISGEFAVGAMVVAIKGKLAPSQYRKFKIKTVKGPNDVMMMREMLQRRQKHAEWPSPQLIILDGGKPQLNTVYPTLKREWKPLLSALAKRKEELFVPGRKASIRLAKNHPALLLVQRLRDQAHRQAIRYYRSLHRKNKGKTG